MQERTITIRSAGATLVGTLRTPAGSGPFPAALLIAGSGPLDRDGNVKRLRLDIGRQLAAALAASGWASLRFDKRGVGASGGEYLTTGFYDELADAEAVCARLAAEPMVSDVVAIGHSVGALMAAELGSTFSELAGVVLLATTAHSGADTLRWQARQLNDHLLPAPINALLKLFGTDLVRQQAKSIAKLEATRSDVVRIQLARINAKWMREFIAYDPGGALERMQVPVLAMTGSKDVQVDSDDLAVVADLVPTPCVTHVVDDMDHILRHEPEARSNPRRYRSQLAKPLDPRVVSALTIWLDERVPFLPVEAG